MKTKRKWKGGSLKFHKLYFYVKKPIIGERKTMDNKKGGREGARGGGYHFMKLFNKKILFFQRSWIYAQLLVNLIKLQGGLLAFKYEHKWSNAMIVETNKNLTSTSLPRRWMAAYPGLRAISSPPRVALRFPSCASSGSPGPSFASGRATRPWKHSSVAWYGRPSLVPAPSSSLGGWSQLSSDQAAGALLASFGKIYSYPRTPALLDSRPSGA